MRCASSVSQKKPIAVFGARQVGKSTSILEFAQRCYDDVVEINFYKDAFLKQAFSTSLRPHDIVQVLEALLNRDIVPGKTLLFLDEIQACDEALTSLKFFCTDAPEYDVIAAGSLLGVHVAGSGSFPVGYIDILEMHRWISKSSLGHAEKNAFSILCVIAFVPILNVLFMTACLSYITITFWWVVCLKQF